MMGRPTATRRGRTERGWRRGGGRALLALLLLPSCHGQPREFSERWTSMGTYAKAQVYSADPRAAARALGTVRRVFEAADSALSNWKEGSELSRANREAAGPAGAAIGEPALGSCLSVALEIARKTDGAFDPTVGPLVRLYGWRPRSPRLPSEAEIQGAVRHIGHEKVLFSPSEGRLRFLDPNLELDLGGIGKGCALDLAAKEIERAGIGSALLDLGGQLTAVGLPPGGGSWRIGIRSPGRPDHLLAVLDTTPGSVSTSSNDEDALEVAGRKLGHILDPRTGKPASSGVFLATVIAPQAAVADALSTALVVAGSGRAPQILERFPGSEAVLFVESGTGSWRVLASASLAGRLWVEPRIAERLSGGVSFELPGRSSR